jgi:NitT/TauT family transport system permease protein
MSEEATQNKIESISRFLRGTSNWMYPIAGTTGFLLLWHLLTTVTGVFPALLVPSPTRVVSEFLRLRELIISNLMTTLWVSIVGFTLAAVTGIGFGLIISMDESVKDGLIPLLIGGNSVPRIAFAPVIIFYVAVVNPKYLIAAWIGFFPILINSIEGFESIDEDLERLMRSLDITTLQEYKAVRIPHALPYIFDGLKVGGITAAVGAIAAEFVMADEGLGVLTLFALRNSNPALALAVVGIMAFAGVILLFTLFILQDRLVYWQDSDLITG